MRTNYEPEIHTLFHFITERDATPNSNAKPDFQIYKRKVMEFHPDVEALGFVFVRPSGHSFPNTFFLPFQPLSRSLLNQNATVLPTTSMDASSWGGGRVCGHKDPPRLTRAHPGQYGHGHSLRGPHAHAVDGGARAGGGGWGR